MNKPTTKPYLIRAIFEWCCECGYAPLLSVSVDAEMPGMHLPEENIKNGEIIFNIGPNAVRNLDIGNDIITFSARFNGVAREVRFPTEAVNGIFAREINQGIAFPELNLQKKKIETTDESLEHVSRKISKPKSPKNGKANLRLIK
ncbi:MAG: ClpXP protease specificity-enhancing factor [Nitrosomonas sp.]|nr:ClpXP protease specificity-enhancing factor [Nitrosomonas sp.]